MLLLMTQLRPLRDVAGHSREAPLVLSVKARCNQCITFRRLTVCRLTNRSVSTTPVHVRWQSSRAGACGQQNGPMGTFSSGAHQMLLVAGCCERALCTALRLATRAIDTRATRYMLALEECYLTGAESRKCTVGIAFLVGATPRKEVVASKT